MDYWSLSIAVLLLAAAAGGLVLLRRIRRSEAQLRESEVHLRNAAQMAGLGYAVWDDIGDRYLSVSESYAALFGYSPADFMALHGVPQNDCPLLHPDDRARYIERERLCKEQNLCLDIEYRIQLPGGGERHVLECTEPINDDSSKAGRSLVTLQDITNLKRAEAQLLLAQKTEVIGQLTSGVAHDFNNLLAIVQGNLELLGLHLTEDGRAKKHLEPALRAVKRGASLTHQLLAFARRQPLSPTSMDLCEQIAALNDLIGRTVGKNIDIETVRQGQVWRCEIDRHQFEIALLNLAINARDAMPSGGKLTIETANVSLDDDYAAAQAEVRPGQYVMVSVSDTGSGMTKEIRDKVFEPFFTTKETGQGTGLGLAMVFGFVKQSDGQVTVYSEPGEGTTVKLYFPRSGDACTCPWAEPGAETRAESGTNGTAKTGHSARGETILVVEDDMDLRILAVTLLGKLGYAVIDAADAETTLQRLESEPAVNLLLTDVILSGGTNGRQLADEATARRPGLPVLYMSGYPGNAILHHGHLAAGVQLLQKPFREADLAKAVRSAMG